MIYKNNKKNVKHIVLVFLFSYVIILPVFTQVEAQLSQYMFHTETFNPASIGENNMIRVIGQHRIQWVGMPGAPQTTYFSINAPFAMGKSTHAAGINFLNDKAGAFKNQSASLQYAYKRKLAGGLVSVGVNLGFMSIGFNADSVKSDIQSEYHEDVDPVVPTTDENGMGFDMSLGVFYSNPKYYAGVSYVHLNKPSFALGSKSTFHARGIAYLTGGFDVNLGESRLVLKPSTLIKSDFTTWQVDVSSRLEYDKKFWGGLSYRFQDAVAVLGGISLSNGLALGYSYDLPTGKLLTVSSGSHEFFLSYSFAFDTSKNKKKYKSIRIL